MSTYTFPFDTCEVPSGGHIAQPWSFAVNLVSTMIMLVAALCTKSIGIFSYFLFEAFHTFSHAVHWEKQRLIVHLLGYVMAACTFYELYRAFGNIRSRLLITLICVAVLLDILLFVFIGGVSSIFTGLLILVLVVIAYRGHMTAEVHGILIFLLWGLGILFVMFVNEAYNCRKLLAYHRYPYHALIEVLGGVLFIGLSTMIIKVRGINIWKIKQ